MDIQHQLSNINIQAMAQEAGLLTGEWKPSGKSLVADSTAPMNRLVAESCVPNGVQSVKWRLFAELRSDVAGQVQPWLNIQASTIIPLVCQRCLLPVDTPIEVDRWYRFVADEETAEAEDDLSEEDVLALESRTDVWNLMEDELLMALPLVPMHSECPVHVPTVVMDPDFSAAEEAKPNPFAVLQRLNKGDLL